MQSSHRTNPAVIAILTALALALAPVAAAQATPWLELEVVDADGRRVAVGDGTEAIDLDASPRRLTLVMRPLVGDVESLTIAVDGITHTILEIGDADVRTFATSVAVGSDDAEEFLDASASDAARWPAGFTYTSSSDLELGVDPPHGRQLVYVRFRDLTVPDPTTLAHAEVRFTADGSSSGPVTLRIVGARVTDANAPGQDEEGSASMGLSTLPRTDASVSWTLDAPWNGGDVVATPDLTEILAEVWTTPGDEPRDIALLFEPVDGDGTRRAFSADRRGGPDGSAPSLHLTTREGPPMPPIAIDLPDAEAVVTITGHGQSAGAGPARYTRRIDVSGPPRTTPMPAPQPEPAAPPPSDAVPAPAPQVPPPPTLGDVEPRLWHVDVGDLGDARTRVTVVLREPVGIDVPLVLRTGTCDAPGSMLTTLRPVLAGERGSTSEVPASFSTLRLASYVVVAEGISAAGCLPLFR